MSAPDPNSRGLEALSTLRVSSPTAPRSTSTDISAPDHAPKKTWISTTTATRVELELKRVIELGGTRRGGSIAVNPKGDRIAIAIGNEIKFYTRSGSFIREIRNHAGPAFSAMFDPTGEWVYARFGRDRGEKALPQHFFRRFKVEDLLRPECENDLGGTKDAEDAVEMSIRTVNFAVNEMKKNGAWTEDEITDDVRKSLGAAVVKAMADNLLKRDFKRGVAIKGELTDSFVGKGRYITVDTAKNERTIMDPETGKVIFILSHPSCEPEDAARGEFVNNDNILWSGESPDGNLIATVSWDSTAILWDATTGEAIRTLRGPKGQNWIGQFAMDSTWFAVGSGGGKVYVWEIAGGELIATLDVGRDWARQMALDSSGKRLAVGHGEGVVNVYDTADWSLVHHFHVQVPEIERSRVLVGEIGALQYVPQVQDGQSGGKATGQESMLVFITSVRRWIKQNHGGMMSSRDAELRLYSLSADGSAKYVVIPQEMGNGVRVSPDGKEIWTVDGDGGWRTWGMF